MSNNQNENPNLQILLFKKYNLLKNIGGGAFGTVFLGQNVWTKENVAIKIEERKNLKNSLEKEAYILYLLKGPGLPEVISFGKTKRYNILVETLLGRSLYQIFNDCDKLFNIKDICMLAIQMIERLEYIHSKNFIHRDIKPHNFLVSPKNEGLIYLIDFGLAKKYMSERGNHVKFAVTKHITGTPRFCSINAMRGVEQSRRDDLESLSYLILYFLKGSLPWQGLKIASRPQRFKEITRIKKNLNIDNFCQNFPPEIIIFCKYVRNLGFAENPKYEYMKKLFHSILNKYGNINDKKFSWINKEFDTNNGNITNFHLHKKSPHKRLIEQLRTSLEKKQRAKSKEKDNKNDYTLTTIFMDNKNNISDISELNKRQNDLGQKIMIQSNDNDILIKNNIIQLNIDNTKHSYNYPLVIYKNNLKNKNENNNFNKIVKTFQSNDSNVMQQSEMNFPDKISMINASGSNLINIQFISNQDLLLSENKNEKEKNQNKTIKIHDYIRQEEKEGGVIDKDFDYKENDYFKINKPIFPSEQSEQDNEGNNNKLIYVKNKSKGNKNEIIKSKTYVSHYNMTDNNLNNNNDKANVKYNNEYEMKNNNIKSNNDNIIFSSKLNDNIKIKKCQSPKNNGQIFNSFFVKKVNINLNKNLNNISPNTFHSKINNNYAQINQSNIKQKNSLLNPKFKQFQGNSNVSHQQLKNANQSYELSNNYLRSLNKNTIYNINYQTENNNIIKDKYNANYKKINPTVNMQRINEKNIIGQYNTNRINYIRQNYNKADKNINVLRKSQLNSINIEERNKMNKLRNNFNNNHLHFINMKNNPIMEENKPNKSYQIKSSYQNMNLSQYKKINNNLNINQKNIQSDRKNNIIINNVTSNIIIKNNCNNLLNKNNLNKNQIKRSIINRNDIEPYNLKNSSSQNQYKPFLERHNFKGRNIILTSPK